MINPATWRRTDAPRGVRRFALVGPALAMLALFGQSASAAVCDTTDAPQRTGPAVPAPRAEGAVTIFQGDTDGVDTYRIPGAATTPTGAIVVAAEQRTLSPLDSDPHSLVSRRSTDGGRTWGAKAEVAPVLTEGVGCIPSDPVLLAPATGPTAGEVLIIHHCREGSGLRISRSSDDGASWSPPEPLGLATTPQVPQSVIDRFRPGPGHGVELTVGPSAGRLVAAADTSADGKATLVLVVSDDGGRSWRIGATLISDPDSGPIPDETAIAELADGTLVLSSRNASSKASGRIFARSSDGGASFDRWPSGQALEVDPSVTVPVVQGSLLTTPDGDRAVFASPSDPTYRRGLALWTSTTGADWAPGPLIVPGPAAYSDLVAVDDDTLGLVVETGDRNPYERIDFVPVPTSRLDEPRTPLPNDFDVAGAVAGRLVVDGKRFSITRFCLFSDRVELDGGYLTADISGGLDAVKVRLHLDDRGDGRPLDLEGTVALDLTSGISYRGTQTDDEGVAHELDLVMVNFEPCVEPPPGETGVCDNPTSGTDGADSLADDPAAGASGVAEPPAPRLTG